MKQSENSGKKAAKARKEAAATEEVEDGGESTEVKE